MADYPTIDNFNPGGEDATLTNEVTGQRDQKINGGGPNGIRDKDEDMDLHPREEW